MAEKDHQDNPSFAEFTNDDGYVPCPVSAEMLDELTEKLKSGPSSVALTVFEDTALEFTVEHPELEQLAGRESDDEPIYTDIKDEDFEAKFYLDEK